MTRSHGFLHIWHRRSGPVATRPQACPLPAFPLPVPLVTPSRGSPFTFQARPVARSSARCWCSLLTLPLCSHRASPKSHTATESPATAGGLPGAAPTPRHGQGSDNLPSGSWRRLTHRDSGAQRDSSPGGATLVPSCLPCPALQTLTRWRQMSCRRRFRASRAVYLMKSKLPYYKP